MSARILVHAARLEDAVAAGVSPDDFAAMLPDALRARILRHVMPQDRQTRLLSRVLLDRALAEMGAGGLADVAVDRAGRPYLPGGFDLSISHSAGLACVAVSAGCRVGIDVEQVRPVEPGVHDRVLDAEEQDMMRRADQPARRFVAFWTMKEAAAKLDGRGLRLDPRAVACRPAENGATAEIEGRRWALRPLDLPEGWIGHLAYPPEACPEITFPRYSFG